MKLIGEKSISTILSKILLIGCMGQLLYLGYLIFGFIVAYTNLHQETLFFSDIFKTGNFNNEVDSTASNALAFQFNIPFSEAVIKGNFTFSTFTSILFFLGFYSLFTFYLFRIFKGMSTDIIFNKETIRYLRKFAFLNIIFIPIYSIVLYFIDQSVYSIDPMFILLHLATVIIIIFIIEFFKKGYELQTQTDLTI